MKVNKDNSDIIFYESVDGEIKINVLFQGDTVWLTQKQISVLFNVNVPAISKHLKKIFDSDELDENSVISILETTANDGKKYLTTHYNLDAIIAVGYRVNSKKATQFRIWATKTLREFILKGFVLDDERLKNGEKFGKDYFEDLLERIRAIRASERRFYQKITDIYALSVDYDKNSELTKNFFATVQNKLHWAITGKTASEIVYLEADSKKEHMGLKTWKNSPKGLILKSDTVIAKNYLDEKNIKELEGIVSAYLDLAENRAKRGILMKMSDWVDFINDFLKLSKYPILNDKGKVSALKAKLKAEKEYDKFRIIQDRIFESDFDIEIKRVLEDKK